MSKIHFFVNVTKMTHPEHGEIVFVTRMVTGKFVCAHYTNLDGQTTHMKRPQFDFWCRAHGFSVLGEP